jgi:hypothetical protein
MLCRRFAPFAVSSIAAPDLSVGRDKPLRRQIERRSLPGMTGERSPILYGDRNLRGDSD